MQYFDTIRRAEDKLPASSFFMTLLVFLLGIMLGVFSKYLDHHQAHLPSFLMMIDRAVDLHNFLGRFSPWIFLAVCISVYNRAAWKAAVDVLVFFFGMVSSYYLYSNFIAGFFPRRYAMIWVGFTLLSPLLAYLCWYAKGTGWPAIIISAGIIGTLFNTAFAYGAFYFSVRYWPEVITLISAIVILRRSAKEMPIMLGTGIVLAFLMQKLLPFNIW